MRLQQSVRRLGAAVLLAGWCGIAFPDNQPPIVTGVSPINGAINVPVSPFQIIVDFSEAMNINTLLGGAVFVENEAGTFHLNANWWEVQQRQVRILSTTPYQPGTTYFVHVTMDATDAAGNHLAQEFVSSFTTDSVVDVTPPSVIAVSPADGAVNIPTAPFQIIVDFSEAMNINTLLGGAVFVENEAGTFHLNANWWEVQQRQVRILSTTPYQPGTTYFVHVTMDATDAAGNHLTQDFVSSFTTRCLDDDNDGLCNEADNCPGVANVDQDDLDVDGFGGACDCDDSNGDVFPSAPEVCDGINNDCSDGSWPTLPASEVDADGDSFAECQGDCNDTDTTIYPQAPLLCDGKANDCLDPSWPTVPMIESDSDGDGVLACSGDCDDGNADVYPGALEICNSIDDDCDALVDEGEQELDSDGDGSHNACDNCRFAFNPDQLDADGDSIGNACDNCVGLANPGQQDLDSDQRGDACDNCPAAYNPFQDDFDGDSRGDVCDTCLVDYNPSQSDFDHDGQGDYCDLNDVLIYVFSSDENYVEWQAESGPSAWNVYEGDLSVLRSSGVYTQVPGSNPLAQRTCGLPDPYLEDFESLAAGAVKFSLVTGITGGVEGSLGTNSAGATRPNANPCP